MIRFCLRANWRRHTDVKQGSDEWKRHKSEGGSFGSSQCAAVFPGVSTTCSHPELVESLFDRSAPWTLVIVTARDDIKNRCDRTVEWS